MRVYMPARMSAEGKVMQKTNEGKWLCKGGNV